MSRSRSAVLVVSTLGVQVFCGASSATAEVFGRVPTSHVFEVSAISGNGRFLVGTGTDGPCGPTKGAPAFDVFLYDRQTGTWECVSVNDAGVPASGLSLSAQVSADGRLVVFQSDAATLDPRCAGTTSHYNVFVRDRRTRHTECLTVLPKDPRGGGGVYPRISARGNLVVFSSRSPDFVAGDANGGMDVFAVRLADGIPDGLECLTLPDGSLLPWPIAADSPIAVVGADVSADGEFVVFASAAPLVANDTNGQTDIYRRDRTTGRNARISESPSGVQADGNSATPSITPDGRFVAFLSRATNLVDGLAAAGVQLYRRDMQSGRVIRVAPAHAAGSPGLVGPNMSADGRFIVFPSQASDLVYGDTNRRDDLFAADFNGGTVTITRLSVSSSGAQQNGEPGSIRATAISADARVVAFNTNATNLVPDSGSGPFLARIPNGPTQVVAGAGRGGGPIVRGMNLSGVSDPQRDFYAYGAAFRGGVAVAYGDIDGDGAADMVTGAGPGAAPHVRVFSAARRTGATTAPHELVSFHAYHPAFSGGVWVAVGDVTGDGVAELITGAGPGGGPHVRVFQVATHLATGTPTVSEYASFYAYDARFGGGVRVATGDLDGDGAAEIITAAGPGGGPHVMAFTLTEARTAIPVVSFFAYGATFRGGVFAAAGDMDGDGRDEIITGADAGGGPHVRTFSAGAGHGAVSEISSFHAYDAAFSGGVRVAAGDLDGDGLADIITAPGPHGSRRIRAFRPTASGGAREIGSFDAFDTAFDGGVFLAAPR